MVRVFVAGATGVIGRRVVPLLIAEGHDVTALVRTSEAAAAAGAAGATPAQADVYDAAALERVVAAAEPELVMHQLTDLRSGTGAANAEIRTRGSRNLVDAAIAAGARRIVAQSLAWAYEPGDTPAAESTRLDLGAAEPRGATVRGVAALEAAVRDVPEWVVLRYGLFYGPGTWYAPDGSQAETARSGGLAADDDITSLLHIDDAASAAVQSLTWPTGAVNICDDEPARGRDWVPAFCRAVAAPPPAPVAAASARRGWARGADNAYARTQLGWVPRYPSWRDGFASFAARAG